MYDPYFHFCLELVLETWATRGVLHGFSSCSYDLCCTPTHLQWSGPSNQQMLLSTENCLIVPKWSPYKGRGAVSTPVCAEKGRTKAFLQPTKTATTYTTCNNYASPLPPIPHFLLAQNLSLKAHPPTVKLFIACRMVFAGTKDR